MMDVNITAETIKSLIESGQLDIALSIVADVANQYVHVMNNILQLL